MSPSPLPGAGSDPELSLQDALFFLKDFFTSLAASINPMVPGDTLEGERPGQGGSLDPGYPTSSVPSLISDLSFCSSPRDPQPAQQPPGRAV